MKREVLKLLALAEVQGFRVEKTRSGHVTVRKPDGTWVATNGTTPSSYRGVRNFAGQLRRGGVEIPRRGTRS